METYTPLILEYFPLQAQIAKPLMLMEMFS